MNRIISLKDRLLKFTQEESITWTDVGKTFTKTTSIHEWKQKKRANEEYKGTPTTS